MTSSKKIKLSIALVLCCVFSGFSQTNGDALTYLNAIGMEYEKLSKDIMAYISAANHGKSARKVEKRRLELVTQLKRSEQTIRKMKPFQGSTQLRDSVTAYFRMNVHVINEDYGKIVDLEDIAEQSYDAMEAYLLAKEKAGDKIEAAFDAVQIEYKSFANKNNINLIEGDSKLNNRLKDASEVNAYHRTIYLIFFKSYKNEAYLLDAIKAGSVGQMEQTRNALLTSATEDLSKIGPVQAFKGDLSLKNVTQQVLSFYKSETTKIPSLIDFILAKENFEKLTKSIESNTNRTQDDVSKYNAAVKDFNAKVNLSNQVNDELYKKRSALLKAWNETSEAFLHKHTP